MFLRYGYLPCIVINNYGYLPCIVITDYGYLPCIVKTKYGYLLVVRVGQEVRLVLGCRLVPTMQI